MYAVVEGGQCAVKGFEAHTARNIRQLGEPDRPGCFEKAHRGHDRRAVR
jgi:hypothetical protein